MIDLQKYCSTELFKLYLHHPFSQSNYTYATNGHILVRVPLRPDVEKQKKPNVSSVWPKYEPTAWIAPLTFDFPEPESLPCKDCYNGGRVHDCPGCECVCQKCGGTEEIFVIRAVKLGPLYIQEKYARLMMELPKIEIEAQPPLMGPVQFRFDGGRGLVMPCILPGHGGKSVPIIGTMMEEPAP